MLLFDPVTCQRTNINFDKLKGITGKSECYLYDCMMNGKKIKSINCYLIDDTVKPSQLRVLMSNEKIKDECWKDIPESDHEVSSYGRYRNKNEGTFIIISSKKESGRKKFRPQLNIYVDGHKRTFHPHTWVAKLFLEDASRNDMIPAHKDGNSFNCRAGNLYYVSSLKQKSLSGRVNTRGTVFKVNDDGYIVADYPSMAQASIRQFYNIKAVQSARALGCKTGGYRYLLEEEYMQIYGEPKYLEDMMYI